MNKTIRNLAIAALFIFPGLTGLPQGLQQPAAPVAPVSAQTAQAQADQLRAQAAQLQAQAAQLQAQAAQVQPVQALPVQQTNPLAGLITMIDARSGAIVGTKKKLDIF